MKRVIVLGVIALALLSLSSCRSKKNTCDVDTQVQVQQPAQEVEVACIEAE